MFAYVKRNLLPRAAALLPMEWLHRLAGGGVLLPYYHLVTDEAAPHVENLYRFRNTREFTADLEFFLRYFEPISVGDLLNSLAGQVRLPRRAFLLSFDDGFREMHDIVAPILVKKGIPAAFFLNSAMHDNRDLCFHQKISLILDARWQLGDYFPEVAIRDLLREEGFNQPSMVATLRSLPWARVDLVAQIGALCGCDFQKFLRDARPYLNTPQVNSMIGMGFDFGGHSVDHPLYSEISLHEQLRQTRESVDFVQQQFGTKRRIFAFPHMDRGVSESFFQTVFEAGEVEATFGTGAPSYDVFPRSFQRFAMEKTSSPARAVLARQSLRGVKLQSTGHRAIHRSPGGESCR